MQEERGGGGRMRNLSQKWSNAQGLGPEGGGDAYAGRQQRCGILAAPVVSIHNKGQGDKGGQGGTDCLPCHSEGCGPSKQSRYYIYAVIAA